MTFGEKVKNLRKNKGLSNLLIMGNLFPIPFQHHT